MHNVNETVADDTSNEKSLIHQDNVSDQLKTIEDYKHEPDDTKVVVEPLTSIKPEVKEAPMKPTQQNEVNKVIFQSWSQMFKWWGFCILKSS